AAAFTIEKEQRIEGQGGFTKEKLKAEVGQTVEYGITVLNLGNTTIEFGPLSDAKCANISPAGNTTLKAGEEASFTCAHVLVVGDEPLYTNVASIEGAGKTEGSNEVEVEVGPKPAAAFTIEKEQRIEGQGVFTKEK